MASADEKLAIQNLAVWVEWKCSADDEVKCLDDTDHATLDFGLSQSCREAHLKIRVPVGLKGRAKKTNLYFFIRPEHLSMLKVGGDPSAVSPAVKASFVRTGDCSEPENIIALHCTLKQAGVLVGPPPTPPLLPKSKKATETLACLKSLARATSLTLYLPDSHSVPTLFGSASDFVSNGGLKSSYDEYLFERLYSGRGGRLVDVEIDPLREDSPPSYDELGPSPPPPPRKKRQSSPLFPAPPKKTKQEHLDHATHHPSDNEVPDIGHADNRSADCWKQMLEARLEALFGEVAAVRKGVSDSPRASTASEHADETNSRLDRIEKQMEELRDQMNELQKSLQEVSVEREQELEKRLERRLEVRLERRLQQQFNESWKDASEAMEERVEQMIEQSLDDRLEEVVEDAVEQADVRVEERSLQTKDEMQSFVREELQIVKEELRDGFQLGSAVLRVEFEQ